MNGLIYTSNLDGHREIFTNVICGLFLELGARVFLLIPVQEKEKLIYFPYIDILLNLNDIQIIPYRQDYDNNNLSLSADELIAIQKKYKIDVTFFEGGDLFIPEIIRLSESRKTLYAYNLGIFSFTYSWYPNENPYTGNKELNGTSIYRGLKYLKNKLLNNHTYFDEVKKEPHYFFPEYLSDGKIFNKVLMADERVANKYGDPFLWQPSIYRSFMKLDEAIFSEESNNYLIPYYDFLSKNCDKKVLLYFGSSYKHRGYDKLLRLAVSDSGSCFVHCGKKLNETLGDPNIAALLTKLYKENRIFETDSYIKSFDIIDEFYNSTDSVISTHNYLGPSGTMIHAISLGKPILTPDKGLIGYRTKKNNLGLTYIHNSERDLLTKWSEMKNIKKQQFEKSLKNYSQLFTKEYLLNNFKKALNIR